MKTIAVERPSFESQVYNVDIEPRQSIRLYGAYKNHCEYSNNPDGTHTRIDQPKPFDITFKIGDVAEYDSYNLKYLGKIVAIGEKTITIDPGYNWEGKKRLDLWHFAWRNWDFDINKIREYNAEERMYI
jgi:hypothetical protein